jgi:hypothetical protein
MMRFILLGLMMASSLGVASLGSSRLGAAEPVKLVKMECNQADLVMTGTELERAEKTSTIRVVRKKGGSVGSSLFVMGVFLEVAEARKCEYFVNLKEWRADDGSWMIVGGFTNRKDADIKKEFGEQYDYQDEHGQTRRFLSVSELNRMKRAFKPEP